MEKIKVLFEKIKKYIIKILAKEKVLYFKENTFYDDYEQCNISQEKKDFLELYQNVKKGYIPIENLLINDLIKVLAMSQEELSIEEQKNNFCENKLTKTKEELDILKTQNSMYRKKLNIS